MPIYEYECADCGHRLEAIQKFSDAPLSDCPTCGKAALKRLISAAGFQLKGTGWYVTDFRNSGQKKAGTKAGGDDQPSGNGDSKAGDSKATEGGTKAHSCGSGACGCAS